MERRAAANGIWLCQTCDSDLARYPVALLQRWKEDTEAKTFAEIGKPADGASVSEILRPLVVIEYDCDYEEAPETPFVLQNASKRTAYDVGITVSDHDSGELRFERVPKIAAGDRFEVMAELLREGLAHGGGCAASSMIWDEERWQPSLKLPAPPNHFTLARRMGFRR